ncbi:MAG: nickel-dependent hydrogenase large subunit [candidate division WOR-3 bacterium]|nr:nickel-dependent hydrogenase large subunit [candidate division WOR-3 bacterium]MCX7756883.1 nickel-dependent hydrogenase large subunit [candidate division WOR-3 bacterium]MDW7987393.1 nickel-dependent hydrogenase large subunit [candidate division WOR-3 bacterium]
MSKRIVPIGPYHPLQEEPEFFKLIVEGETVVDIEINIGYNHRGHEFLSPSLTYDQIPFLVERICGICSNSHPLAFVLAVEDMAHIKVPERALYIRTIVHELERIHSHLLWIGLAGHFIGYNTIWMWAWRYREPVLDLFEMITGNRNHYAMNKVGGVRRNIYHDQISHIEKVLDLVESKVSMLTKAVLDDPVLHARLKGIGILSKEAAISYGVVGPTARASGVAIDVRKDDPHCAYDKVEWDIVVEEAGDIFAKAKVRLLECFESIKIIRQCLKNLPDTPIEIRIEELPAGEGIGRTEAPRGEVFHYIRGNGSHHPVRHKVRAPSYMNLPSNEVTVKGHSIADAALCLAAIDPCYCCTERVAVFEDGKLKYTWNDLLLFSWKKTEQIRARLRK